MIAATQTTARRLWSGKRSKAAKTSSNNKVLRYIPNNKDKISGKNSVREFDRFIHAADRYTTPLCVKDQVGPDCSESTIQLEMVTLLNHTYINDSWRTTRHDDPHIKTHGYAHRVMSAYNAGLTSSSDKNSSCESSSNSSGSEEEIMPSSIR